MIEVLKLSCMAQKLYLVWDEKYEFKRNLKISCSLHYSKKKLVNGCQSIALGVDVKRTSKQWISVNYL